MLEDSFVIWISALRKRPYRGSAHIGAQRKPYTWAVLIGPRVQAKREKHRRAEKEGKSRARFTSPRKSRVIGLLGKEELYS
ncbi:hypothetical protein OIU76_020356 [Salix suchowensis]|nr:hypothetical protein OIU76_020356 [Salix suchowensis]KAJ6315452.1 hypothetical protein OIU78_018852 [Salix suchowensis]